MSMHVVFTALSDSSLARTLNSQGNNSANIHKNFVLTNISKLTVLS